MLAAELKLIELVVEFWAESIEGLVESIESIEVAKAAELIPSELIEGLIELVDGTELIPELAEASELVL